MRKNLTRNPHKIQSVSVHSTDRIIITSVFHHSTLLTMAAQIAPAFMASMPLLGNANQSWAQQREKKWAAISMSTPSATSSNLATFDLHTFNALLQTSQHSLCAEIEAIDGLGKFSTNPWESDTGKGVTRGKVSSSSLHMSSHMPLTPPQHESV